MPTVLQTKAEQLAAKRKALAEHFAQYPDLDVPADKSDDFAKQSKQMNDELSALGIAYDALREQDQIRAENERKLQELDQPVRTLPHQGGAAAGEAHQPDRKSLGRRFVESQAFKGYNASNSRGPIMEIPYEVKTLMTEAAGFAPQAIRTGQVIMSPQQQPKLVDVIPATTTTMIAVVYMRETTFTNNAAETAEGGSYPEAALAFTEESSPVRKIAVFLPVTDEQLADISGMEDMINNRLLLMLRQRVDLQLVAGNGTPPNLTGILNTGSILTQATGGDSNVDAIYKAIVQVAYTGFADPSAVLLHPLNYQSIRLLKTTIGSYIFGDPGSAELPRLWGLPVVQSTYVTEDSGIVGDFQMYSSLAYKAGIEFEVSNSHSDYFAKGQLAIRAQLRAAFTIFRPQAFCAVTSLSHA